MSNNIATPATQRRRRTWYGCFAVENMDEITDRIRNLIGAGQPYTFVANNVAHIHSHPHVRTSQQVDTHNGNPITAKVSKLDNDTPFAHISVSDSYGAWGISTTHQTRADAEAAKIHTYVMIEGGVDEFGVGGRDRIEITQTNGYGETLHWVIAPEHPTDA